MTCIVAVGVIGVVLVTSVWLALYANYRWMQRIADRNAEDHPNGREHPGRKPEGE